MIKAIFFDIDGTLLSFKTHKMPQSTIDAINVVKRKGIKVIIATGRLFSHIQGLDEIEFDGFITVNGSYCVDTKGNVIGEKTIPKKELEDLIAYERDVMPFAFAFMSGQGTFVNRADEAVKKIYDMLNIETPTPRNLSTMVDEQIFQLNLFVDKDQEAIIMREALSSCESSRWHPIFSDVNIRGMNKSVGIAEFLKYYNIDKSETMAFGDGGNDIEMLKYVEIGVAMGNADDEVKAAANYVTDSIDNDGVAKALRHFGLID